jgi:WD40 repeat protein
VTLNYHAVIVWDARTGLEITRFSRKGGFLVHCGAVVSPDGKTVAAAGFSSDYKTTDLFLLDVASSKQAQRLSHPHGIGRFLFSPDGKTIATAELPSDDNADRTLGIWDIASGEELRKVTLKNSAHEACGMIAFSPDARKLAILVSDCTVRICDAATGDQETLVRLPGTAWRLSCLTFSPDGRYLAVGATGCDTITVWDHQKDKVIHQWRLPCPLTDAAISKLNADERRSYEHGSWAVVRSVCYSPDGKTLAIVCAHQTLLLEVATGRVKHSFAPQLDAAFSPSGRILATSSAEDQAVYLWDWRDPNTHKIGPLGPDAIHTALANLAGNDPALAYRACAILAANPSRSVPEIAKIVCPVPTVTERQLAQLIADLDENDFRIREQATERLQQLGEAARAALLRARQRGPSAEAMSRLNLLVSELDEWPTRRPHLLSLRGIEVLEYIGSKEARDVLERLAEGALGARETEDARAALKRLEQQRPSSSH